MTTQTRLRNRADVLHPRDPETSALLREAATVIDLLSQPKDVEDGA